MGALLVAPFHELDVTDHSASVRAPTKDFDLEQILAALNVVVGAIRPESPTRTLVSMQHVVPLDQADYDAARHSAAMELLGGTAKALGVTDFALMMDGQTADETVEYQVEFGVVQQEEILGRLARWVGRMGHLGQSSFGEEPWEDVALPGTALFADSGWTLKEPPPSAPDETVDWVEKQVSRLMDLSKRMIGLLVDAVKGTALSGDDVLR